MGRRKRKELDNVEIIDIADKGKSIGRDEEGKIIMVDGPVPGDIVKVLSLRKRKGVLNGIVLDYIKESEDRVEPLCQHFQVCGGCKWQHLNYDKQIFYKERQVRNALKRIAKIEPSEFFPIMGCEEIENYRNKLEFSFSNKRWLEESEIACQEKIDDRDALGFHRPGAWDKIVDVVECHLQPEPSNSIRNRVRSYAKENDFSFFAPRDSEGLLRNMIIRTSTTSDVMVIMVFFYNDEEKISGMMDMLKEEFPEISSLMYVINSKANDTLYDQDILNWSGEDFIIEKLGDIKFKVGPKSFFQTNTNQAKRLYDIVVDFADLSGTENIYDLYTGLGSIALYLADKCKSVTGIETIPSAIEDAKINMELNNIHNANFYAGDVKDILNNKFKSKHGNPDLIITDPPRAGMHKDVVNYLLELAAPKMIYVSCNPATQARDLQLLSEKYDLVKIQPVDMFPHTSHIESVALLHLKN